MSKTWKIVTADGRVLEEKCVWGQPLQAIQIGNIDLVEIKWKPGISNLDYEKNPTSWFIWVNGEDTGQSAETLDEAVIVALAHKYDQKYSGAPMFVKRLLKMP